MKKLIAIACMFFVLTGCSGETKKESKTCSVEMSGTNVDIKMNAENDIIKTIDMNLIIPSSLLGGDASVLKKNDLKTMGDAFLSALNVKEGEGVSSEFTIDGKNLKAVVKFDLSKNGTNGLSAFGITGNNKDIKLSETVKNAEISGATCK